MRLWSAVILAAILGGGLTPGRAMAQDDAALLPGGLFARDRNISVSERPQPDYSPLPLHAAGFTVSPEIDTGVETDDNVRAAATNRRSDTLIRIEPRLTVASDWVRNALSAYARLNAARYGRAKSEDQTGGAVGTDGRLEVHHDLGVAVGVRYETGAEPRTDTASPPDAVRPCDIGRRPPMRRRPKLWIGCV